jgi:hypothetical protein
LIARKVALQLLKKILIRIIDVIFQNDTDRNSAF